MLEQRPSRTWCLLVTLFGVNAVEGPLEQRVALGSSVSPSRLHVPRTTSRPVRIERCDHFYGRGAAQHLRNVALNINPGIKVHTPEVIKCKTHVVLGVRSFRDRRSRLAPRESTSLQ